MALSATGSGASRSVVYRLIADISGFAPRMAQAGASTKKLATDLTAVGKEGERARKGLDQVGRTAGRIGLVAAAGLGVMVARATDFESAMSNVEAATHETESNMRLLRDAAVDFGASTQFSASEAAGAIENLAKAGVSTADILGGALKGSLDLAAAGQLPVAEAAEIAATALTQFQLEGSQATHVADLLAAGAGKAQGEVTDMANALKFAGVPAANLGVSIEETAGAIALFAKNGIIGEQAGTSLRGMLSSLTSPSLIAQKEMEKLGISLFDAQGEFIGLAGVAEQLHTQLGTLTEQERANSLGRIFGNEQLQAANVLYREGGDAVREWTREVDDAGFAASTAAIKTDNLRGDIERLGGALDAALISGGSGSQGALRNLVQGLTSAVDAYNKLPGSAQNAATGLLAASALVGGTIWVGSKLVRTVADTRAALADLGPAGQKAGRGLAIATKGMAALTAGLLAYQAGKEIFDIGIDNDEIRRQTELIQARYGNDVQAQIAAVNELIKEQQKITGEGVAVNLGVAKIFSDQDAADAHNRINELNKVLAEMNHQLLVSQIEAGNTAATIPILGQVVSGLNTQTDKTATIVTRAGRAFTFTAEQVEAAKKAYADAKEAARDVGSEFFGLGEKVDKSRVSLGKWTDDLVKQAEALEQFTTNAKKAAENGLDKGLIKSLEEAGPAGALRMKQLADASDAEIRRVNRAWRRGQQAIDDYVKATTKVPRPLRLDVETGRAEANVRRLSALLAGLRSAQMEVRLGAPTFASGGRVVGPGTGTSDSIPAYLSNGEYVIKAEAVRRYGAHMFDRLNAMQFAQGGFVGSAAPAAVDTGSLVAALAQMRPLVGSMDVQVKNYDDLKRIEARVRSAGSMDGWRK